MRARKRPSSLLDSRAVAVCSARAFSGGTEVVTAPEQSALIAVGMSATAVAMKAKVGAVNALDVLDLLAKVLQWAPEDADLRVAVLDFKARFRDDPRRAGDALLTFIVDRCHPAAARTARDLPGLITNLEAEFATGQFDWQQRKDLQ